MPMEKRIPQATNPGRSAEAANPQNSTKHSNTPESAQRDRVEFLKQVRQKRSKW
jgi:hypothetical protein